MSYAADELMARGMPAGQAILLYPYPLTAAQIASPGADILGLANAGFIFTGTSPGSKYVVNAAGTGLQLLNQTTFAAESYGASAGSSASINTSALQSALNNGGVVTLLTPGIYQFNSTLVVKSNTTFYIGPGVELRAVTGGPLGSSTFTAVTNTNATSTPIALTQIAAAAYSRELFLVTVAFSANHGISAGGYVQIKGDATQIYEGIWEVLTVPSATTVTFLMANTQGGIGNVPPTIGLGIASASQTVANPGVFNTAANVFVQGSPVTITGTPPGGFANNQIYYVIPYGLSTTTVELALSPFATTGIQVTSSSACTLSPVLYGAAADGRITITGGGKINCNFAAGGFIGQASTRDMCMVWRRVLLLTVDGISTQDVYEMSCMSQDTMWPIFRNVHVDSSGDGCHVFGPSWNPIIENFTGTTGDDGVVFDCIAGSAYLYAMLGSGFDRGGNIYNGVIRHIRMRHDQNSAMVVLYPETNSGAAGATNAIYQMRGQITIDDIGPVDVDATAAWYPAATFAIGNNYLPIGGYIDNILVRNMKGRFYIDNSPGVITINKLVFEGAYADHNVPYNALNSIANCTIHELRFKDCDLAANYSGSPVFLTVFSTATVDKLQFTDCTIASTYYTGGSIAVLVSTSGSPTVSTLTFQNCIFGSATIAMSGATFAGPITVNVLGCQTDTAAYDILQWNGTQPLTINVRDLTSYAASAGVFNFYGSPGTIALYATGMTYAGTIFVGYAGTLTMYNPDGSCPVDITKLSRAGAGQIAKHNGGTAITGVVSGDMMLCDTTNTTGSWHALKSPIAVTY